MNTRMIAILLLGIIMNSANALTLEDKQAFVAYYRNLVQLSVEFPEKQQVKVIFVNLDGSGEMEALATSYGSFYEDGWSWAAFKKNGAAWAPIKGFDNHEKVIRTGSGVFARSGEIVQVRTENDKIEFVVLGHNYDNQSSSGIGPLNKTRFWIDADGVLQQEKIQNLEQYLAYRGVHRDKLIQEMQVLKVEVFDVPKKEEPNKAVESTR